MVTRWRPDVIVLDVMLPDVDGFEVARRLTADNEPVPILFLSALDSTEDKVRGLTIGGYDYVTKPFSLEELIARLRNILRRVGALRGGAAPADVRRSRARRRHARGLAGPAADRADRHRVPPAALPDAQRSPRAHSRAVARPRVGLRLRRLRRGCSRPTSAICARRSTRTARRCCTPFAESATCCAFPRTELLSLRARLLIGLSALATLGLAVMAVVTYEEQRSFLYQRVDQQLGASLPLVAGQLGVRSGGVLPTPPRRFDPRLRRRPRTFQASGTYGVLLDQSGKAVKVDAFAYGGSPGPPPAIPPKPPLSEFGSGPAAHLHGQLAGRLGTALPRRGVCGRRRPDPWWSPFRCARSTRPCTGCSRSRAWSAAG